MAKQYVITEEEMLSLIESLELAKLREMDAHAPNSIIHKPDVDSLHRKFHYVAVRWAQSVGFDGYRKH